MLYILKIFLSLVVKALVTFCNLRPRQGSGQWPAAYQQRGSVFKFRLAISPKEMIILLSNWHSQLQLSPTLPSASVSGLQISYQYMTLKAGPKSNNMTQPQWFSVLLRQIPKYIFIHILYYYKRRKLKLSLNNLFDERRKYIFNCKVKVFAHLFVHILG